MFKKINFCKKNHFAEQNDETKNAKQYAAAWIGYFNSELSTCDMENTW